MNNTIMKKKFWKVTSDTGVVLKEGSFESCCMFMENRLNCFLVETEDSIEYKIAQPLRARYSGINLGEKCYIIVK